MNNLIRETLLNCEQGVTKRLDENRELFEILQNEAPELLCKFPWVISWLESQDYFLEQLVNGLENGVDKPLRPVSKDKPDYSGIQEPPMTETEYGQVSNEEPVTLEIDSKNHWYIRFQNNETTIFDPEGEARRC